ncbi:hypothetical protein V8G54_002386 [Vigna mungo]|uniref:Uncharacterized protein n=1 Tax=Vigna mungo TaxID=3915 RepID=A0AAQ3PB87_VIGMU
MAFINTESTVFWSSFFCWGNTLFSSFSASKNSPSPFFFFFWDSFEKYLSSNLSTLTAETSTLVDVAITYDWFTRLNGTPLILKGPKQQVANIRKTRNGWRTKYISKKPKSNPIQISDQCQTKH